MICKNSLNVGKSSAIILLPARIQTLPSSGTTKRKGQHYRAWKSETTPYSRRPGAKTGFPASKTNNKQPSSRGQTSAAVNTASSPRLVALKQLLRIEEEGAYAGLVTGSVPQQVDDEDDVPSDAAVRSSPHQDGSDKLNQQQQRTVRALVSGATRWRRRLDWHISKLTAKSPADLDASVRQVLRVALYELLFQDLPPHALGEFVTLSRRLGCAEGAAGLVNGVLRAAGRQLQDGTLATPEAESAPDREVLTGRKLVRHLATVHSHPDWMVSKWIKTWGREATEKLLESNNRTPQYTVRLNSLSGENITSLTAALQVQGVKVQPCTSLPGWFLEVQEGLQQLLALGFVSDGRCSVQDVAAGLVVALALSPQPGQDILDCCAAPGGKAMFAAALMNGQGHITALDKSATRVLALARTASSSKVPQGMIACEAADLMTWAPKQARQWDAVLVDAPCSGTGVLCKRADLRWRRSEKDVEQLTQLQAELLDAAAPLVKPGGHLVYSTCSIEPEENQGQLAAFLQRHPNFAVKALTAEDAATQGIPASVVSSDGFLTMLPHVHGTDGAFAARLVRLS